MIIRLRTSEGQGRVEVNPTDDVSVLRQKITETLALQGGQFAMAPTSDGSNMITATTGATVGQLGLKHGDFLYISINRPKSDEATSGNEHVSRASDLAAHIKQEEIDNYLEKQDGKIPRTRSNLCKHTASGMCEYCMPLEPYDAKYLEENKIKHLSYHAYLRQLITQNKTAPPTSSQFIPPLEEPEFKIKPGCPGHLPYPEGICTKCQPSAITLQQQTFRMVDHVEFETPQLIERLLQFWRSTGSQRFGFLYGRYEPYAEVPLGIKAVVSAIYEPKQEGLADGIQLTWPEPDENMVEEVAKELGLQRVGMIYTDAVDDGRGKGTVLCKRHQDSYFLSSSECLFAGQMQAKYRVPSKWSSTGSFGSRFVTCVLSGNEDHNIDIFSYQVSNTLMGMARDNIVDASIDPSVMRVRASTSEQYVPEVFYKYKNEYNIDVKSAAKPTFPVDYLLVTLSHGFPQNPQPFFKTNLESKDMFQFPVENRDGLESQNMGTLARMLEMGSLVDVLSNFHLLVYLKSLNILEPADFALACQVAKSGLESDAVKLMASSGWQTLLLILQSQGGGAAPRAAPSAGASSSAGASGSAALASGGDGTWQCQHCTFLNTGSRDGCAMCGLPA